MANIVKRYGTEAELTAANPVLANGEIAEVIDKGYVKVGNGTTAFNSLTAANLINPVFVGLKETAVDLTNSSIINLASGNVFYKTLTENTTFTLSNLPSSGQVVSFLLQLTNGGAYTVGLFAGIKWPGGKTPVLTVSGVDVLGFYTVDSGITWTGIHLGKDVK